MFGGLLKCREGRCFSLLVFFFFFVNLCFIYVYTSGLINATIFLYMFIYKMIKIKSQQILITLVTLLFKSLGSVGAANQHIRMISEGSCDTEDWSNGC